LVAGVARCPMRITKKMGKKRITKRSKVKPFVRYVNYNHMMPTRYYSFLSRLGTSSKVKLNSTPLLTIP
jgi:ribosomal protein L14E/L6E/L27E